MPIGTYNELQASVLRWLARDDLSAVVPDLIALGENRLFNGAGDPLPSEPLRVWQMRHRAQLSAGLEGDVGLPPNLLELVSVTLDGEPLPVLDPTGPDALPRLRSGVAGASPTLYAVRENRSGFQVIVTRPPLAFQTALDAEMWLRPDPLADGGDLSSGVLAAYPQLYLYAALIEAAPFLLEDGRLALWHGLFRAGVTGANRSTALRYRGAGSAVMRPLGQTP